MAGRPALKKGQHGAIALIDLGGDIWLARCRFRDHDGKTRRVERRAEGLNGENAKEALLADLAGRRRKPKPPRLRLVEAHVLYRFFNADNVLLYVGITNHPPTRFKQHSQEKDWWDEVSNITLESFGSRTELAQAERQAIKNEGPRYNIAGTSMRPRKTAEVSAEQRIAELLEENQRLHDRLIAVQHALNGVVVPSLDRLA